MNFQNFSIVPFQIHNYYIQLHSLKYPRTTSCFINCFIAFYLRQYMPFNLVMVRSQSQSFSVSYDYGQIVFPDYAKERAISLVPQAADFVDTQYLRKYSFRFNSIVYANLFTVPGYGISVQPDLLEKLKKHKKGHVKSYISYR